MIDFILLIVVFVFAIAALIITFRNQWVFEKRNELNRFENDVHLIHEYVGYNEMVLKFWIFDIEKFRKNKSTPNDLND